MRIAALQPDIVWHDRAANHEKARQFAGQAAAKGADLFILPEMFPTGFSMDTEVTSESLDGPTPSLYRSLAVQHGMVVVGGFVLEEDKGGRPRNVALAVDREGRDLALYVKVHGIALLEEDRYYDQGNLPVPFQIEGVGAVCFVCYDLRFPELFRTVADHVGLVMVIASWPAARQTHWDILLPARAVENQCFVVGVNRVGHGGGHDFTGGSAVIDPLGRTVAHGGRDECLLVADIDPARVDEVRKSMPFLKDRKAHLLPPGL
ncbi:MAG: carbon-nitrogen family hydrolase [Deltaproteobacteria bacterium]|nr:carbon-nitrogen family hydrolase [Deltaproteobacteria bacterium]MBW1923580.1 carbon-nitrogen family hydrolase [Deltaproteobacteria bacterium]MBW1948572.1 carbon-nitrogen family hydrolase [Deltaproteobacteria bacterium]MBW2006752.1 carbon-nitrogen family hydrolase [Deltaproteobacteria bacterium]MBW2347467.1 carbon-nitrogen family hydrolase [Deltaproteobacteria bacterium]